MTLEELRECNDDFVFAHDIHEIIGCSKNLLRKTARETPERLGFPVCILGNVVKIPRVPFINFVEGK